MSDLHAAALGELMDALYADYSAVTLGEGEFTVRMLADHRGVSAQAAQRIIAAAIADGRIETVGGRSINGRRATAYRMRETPAR